MQVGLKTFTWRKLMVDTILIDGDILVYKAAWACQKTHWTDITTGEFFDNKTKAKQWSVTERGVFNEEDWEHEEILEPWHECANILSIMIQDIVNETKAKDYTIYLSPSKCFRHEIATILPYKDRKTPKPKHYEKAREYLIGAFKAEVQDNLEADDLLGINQTTSTAIASVDKDLKMIPGRHFDIDKKSRSIISKEAADNFFLYQLITGDMTDNVRGVPQWGPVKAKALVRDFAGNTKGLVEEIRELYNENYEQGEDALRETAALLWILRRGETPETAGWRGFLE